MLQKMKRNGEQSSDYAEAKKMILVK